MYIYSVYHARTTFGYSRIREYSCSKSNRHAEMYVTVFFFSLSQWIIIEPGGATRYESPVRFGGPGPSAHIVRPTDQENSQIRQSEQEGDSNSYSRHPNRRTRPGHLAPVTEKADAVRPATARAGRSLFLGKVHLSLTPVVGSVVFAGNLAFCRDVCFHHSAIIYGLYRSSHVRRSLFDQILHLRNRLRLSGFYAVLSVVFCVIHAFYTSTQRPSSACSIAVNLLCKTRVKYSCYFFCFFFFNSIKNYCK